VLRFFVSASFASRYFVEKCRFVKFEPIFALKQLLISRFLVVFLNFSSSWAVPVPYTPIKIVKEQDTAAGSICLHLDRPHCQQHK
jgi:hypothetical protein